LLVAVIAVLAGRHRFTPGSLQWARLYVTSL
jgi:hypothetical protein